MRRSNAGARWTSGREPEERHEPEATRRSRAAAVTEPAWVSCPYCGESIEHLVDAAGGASQEYVEDCEVCCRPWLVRVTIDGDGHAVVSVNTQDEG